ncbi:MAG TPA: polysaccharide biosynthesis protein [Deltaproteobacteria bacterium]|nr:polysaccharide biosynthesis protein [Deltaproteobacteria bacterium]
MQRFVRKTIFNRWSAFLHDLLWVPLALYGAFWIRFDMGAISSLAGKSYFQLLWGAFPVFILSFWSVGLYRGMWRFASMPDFVRIIKSVLLGTVVFIIGYFQYNRLEGIPRTVIFLFPLFLICGLSGPRFLYRLVRDRSVVFHKKIGQRTLIVGAGQGGELLVRDLLRRPEFEPVAIVDDDPTKLGREIHGIRVNGSLDDIESLLDLFEVELVLLAIPSAGRMIVQRVAGVCAKAGVVCRTLPAIEEMNGHEEAASLLRSLTLEDLLGREPVHLDEKAIAGYLFGKSVMVTGGGGSIGSELCRQVAAQRPRRLIVFEHGEFNLYAIDHELQKAFPDLEIIAVLGDVKNEDRVDWAFKKFQPDVVFHAAAYKHVPMLEVNPAEGINNNVFGTRVVADAADRYGVERFVLVSTDKAVNPTNVMGTTKRIAELYCQNLALRSQTKYITTRFGNVLGSAGSVVPLFEKQIKEGGPVTVTHREITRYFMTIPEAVSLILQVGSMGEGGEIYVLDMGEPVLIKDLAEQMIRLCGFEPGKDIEIVYTGLRPGEKLFEEVFHEHENLRGTTHPKLQLAGGRKIDWEWLLDELTTLEIASKSRDVDSLLLHLQTIVPEYDGTSLKKELAARRKNVTPTLRLVAGDER